MMRSKSWYLMKKGLQYCMLIVFTEYIFTWLTTGEILCFNIFMNNNFKSKF